MASVANNNTTYPKAPDFTYHPPFTPLNDTVGSGQMIKGFDQGLIGMAQGQSGIIVVPPNIGYGNINESLISKINISGYVKVFPVNGELLTSPIYGWPVQVKSYNQYYVYIQNIPQIGVQYFPYQGISGFSIIPDSINSNNTISYYFAVTNGTILPNGAYISYVGSTYFELNKNPYLAGKTLYFYVDIIKVD
jgi:FKBP-type peptidyl-prolyl cis-trans isomerase 2